MPLTLRTFPLTNANINCSQIKLFHFLAVISRNSSLVAQYDICSHSTYCAFTVFHFPTPGININTPSPTYSSVRQIILYTDLRLVWNLRMREEVWAATTPVISINYSLGQNCWNTLQYLACPSTMLFCQMGSETRVQTISCNRRLLCCINSIRHHSNWKHG